MLLNMNEMLPPALRVMLESKFRFSLTGSRYFGDPNPNDWDFYVQDDGQAWSPGDYMGSGSLREFLSERAGFVLESGSGYDDPNSAEVWRFDASPTHPQVHVQISNDVRARAAVSEIMKERLLDVYLKSTRLERRQLWRAMFALYNRAVVSELPG